MSTIESPCVIEDLAAEEYHAHPALSNSSLKPIYEEDIETFWALRIAEPYEKPAWATRRKEPTRAMELGTFFHAWMLEGKEPLTPPPDLKWGATGTTNEAKAWKQENPTWVTVKEFEDLSYARDRCLMDPAIRPYFETAGQVELSLFWTDEESGEACRGRLDKLCEFTDGYQILDPKFGSCDPNSMEAVGYKMMDMHYDCQAGMYTDAVETLIAPVVAFNFLFVSNGPPFDAYLWQVSENDIEMGRRHYKMALAEVARRRAENDWHTPRFGTVSMTQLPKRAWDRAVTPQTEKGFRYSEFDAFQGMAGLSNEL